MDEDPTTAVDETRALQQALAAERARVAELQASQAQLLTVLAHAPDFVLELDRRGVITFMNRPAPGHQLSDMIGSDVRRWMEPEHHADFERALACVFETAEPASYESVGSVTKHYYRHRVSPVRSGGAITRAVLITHDISELKAKERELLELESRFRALVSASFEGLVVSIDQTIVDVNQASADLLGVPVEQIIGRHASSFLSPASAQRVEIEISRGTEQPYEVSLRRADGTLVMVEVLGRNALYQGRPARITAIRDLTERKRLEHEQEQREERVRHAQKLETLGVLAGGIAHDFNNLLAVVLANTELALSATVPQSPVQESLRQIRLASQRARGLTQQLLVYAGRASYTEQTVDVAALVEGMTELLRVSLAEKHALRIELQPALPSVVGDPTQLQRVLMHLVTNAADALDGREGTIEVRASCHTLGAKALAELVGADSLPPDEYLCLEVCDDGVGIAAESVARIFDPFFTTKGAGRGLGLATVMGIVRAHRGALGVQSAPQQGTRIRVFLPVHGAVRGRATDAQPLARPATAAHATPRPATIALAEDEPALATVTAELLRATGYQVLVVHDGAALVELVMRRGAEIDALLLDLEMPHLNGLEALRALRAAGSHVPVVLMTGHAPSDLARRATEERVSVVLAKPYEARELFDALARAVGNR